MTALVSDGHTIPDVVQRLQFDTGLWAMHAVVDSDECDLISIPPDALHEVLLSCGEGWEEEDDDDDLDSESAKTGDRAG